MDIASITFDDLLHIRRGGEGLTLGRGSSKVGMINTSSEWEGRAAALREIFQQTLGCPPDLTCPLEVETLSEEERSDHVRRLITYAAAPGEYVRAIVLLPQDVRTTVPGVLCIHPTTSWGKGQAVGDDPSTEGQSRAYGLHLVSRGYVTMAYDLLSAGERCYPGFQDFDTAPFYKQYPNWSVRGRDLWDARRAVDVLQDIDAVDPNRLGCIGHSQGGGITLHAMALDDRLKAGVSSCGEWPDRLSKNPFNGARTGWWVGRPALRPYCYTGKPFPIDLHEYLALAAPRALLHIVALNDWQYGPKQEKLLRRSFENLERNVTSVYDLLSAPDNFVQILHTEGHGFQPLQQQTAYAFFDAHLKG